MRQGLPKAVVRLLEVVFGLSLFGLLAWLAYFVSSRPPGVVVERFGVMTSLLLTAGLSGACSLSAGLLAYHHKREDYGSGPETIYRSCLIVSTGIFLCSGVWAVSILVFG